jgi:hypothetical protein
MPKIIYKQLAHKTKFCIVFPILMLSLLSCGTSQDRLPVSYELLYPAEVPAAFDTVLLVRTAETDNDRLRFQWSSENGTIRGEGESITWSAPAEYGLYKMDVKVIDASDRENAHQAGINVIPFYRTQADPDPEINLKLPVFSNSVVGEQCLVGPLTNAEISCDAPFSNMAGYKYEWSVNGGKIQAVGLKDGTASKIGWISPGVPGNYTVIVKAVNTWGNITVGSVYFQVKNPNCCGPQDTGELYQWKK